MSICLCRILPEYDRNRLESRTGIAGYCFTPEIPVTAVMSVSICSVTGDFASGNFEPINVKKLGRAISIRPQNEKICNAIQNHTYKMLCLNDMDLLPSQSDFEKAKQEIIDAFEKVLPEKSSSEK